MGAGRSVQEEDEEVKMSRSEFNRLYVESPISGVTLFKFAGLTFLAEDPEVAARVHAITLTALNEGRNVAETVAAVEKAGAKRVK